MKKYALSTYNNKYTLYFKETYDIIYSTDSLFDMYMFLCLHIPKQKENKK